MIQWGFYFNQDRCVGCKTCVMACKNWNEARRGDAAVNGRDYKGKQVGLGRLEPLTHFVNPTTGTSHYEEFRKFHMKEDWRRVETHEKGGVMQRSDYTFASTFDRRYLSIACNHCDRPACKKACPQGIITKEPTYGIVLVNNTDCISCGECKTACPWEAPQFYHYEFNSFDEDDPKRPRMTKCTLCIDRIVEGLKPACVAACWNRALDAGPMDELKAKYVDHAVTGLPEFKSDFVAGLKIHLRPNIIFKKKATCKN